MFLRGMQMHLSLEEVLLGSLPAIFVGLLVFGLVTAPAEPVLEKILGHDPGPYILDRSFGVGPEGKVTGVIALETILRNGQLEVIGSMPRLYVGGQYFHLSFQEREPSIDDLNLMGVPLSADNPFVIVDLIVEPWYGPGGDTVRPMGGIVVIASVQRVWELDLGAAAGGLISEFSAIEGDYRAELSLARGVLDPDAYNTEITTVAVTYDDGSPMAVFDRVSRYEGVLDWYIRPIHLMVAAFELTDDGEVTRVTTVPPHVQSRATEGIRLTLFIAKGEAVAGEELLFMFALENEGRKTYQVQTGPPFFDLNLYDDSGSLVGSWSSGKGFPEYVETIVLEPGEVRRHSLLWDLSTHDAETSTFSYPATGQYQVSAVWVSEGLETPRIGLKVDSGRPALSLAWVRSGGFAGLNEQLRMALDGEMTFEDLRAGTKVSSILSPAEHWALFDFLNAHGLAEIVPEDFGAKSGAADFFIHELTASLDGNEKDLRWVDEWAAEPALPTSVIEIQSAVEGVALRFRGGGWGPD
jgi:hypothetical protein